MYNITGFYDYFSSNYSNEKKQNLSFRIFCIRKSTSKIEKKNTQTLSTRNLLFLDGKIKKPTYKFYFSIELTNYKKTLLFQKYKKYISSLCHHCDTTILIIVPINIQSIVPMSSLGQDPLKLFEQLTIF